MPAKTRIFLASSNELKAERTALEVRIARCNKAWVDDGIFLDLTIWEDFDETMSSTRKQDDYNAAIRQCDLFVLLVHTKVGEFSREEFDTAHAQFMASDRPRILTCFKNFLSAREPDPTPEYASVRALYARLAGLGHFISRYEHPSELLDFFSGQLDKLRQQGFIAGHPAPAASKAAPSVGAGGVLIGGNNSGSINTGTQTNIRTGGGAYFGGPVTVNNGNLIGRDWVQQMQQRDRSLVGELLATLAEWQASPDPAAVAQPMARLLAGLSDLVGPELARGLIDQLQRGR